MQENDLDGKSARENEGVHEGDGGEAASSPDMGAETYIVDAGGDAVLEFTRSDIEGEKEIVSLVSGDGMPGPIDQAIDLLHMGGPVVMILLVLSIIALTIILYKLLQYSVLGIARKRPVERALVLCRDGKLREGLAAVQGVRDPVSRMVALAIRGRLRKNVDEASVREEVDRVGGIYLKNLGAQLGVLELIGSIAPLLGLLGTVLGMIDAFRAMEAAGRNVDPSILSGGIWIALLTTAAGLAVAIPVVSITNWFDRIVAITAHRIEDAVTRVFTPDLSTLSDVSG